VLTCKAGLAHGGFEGLRGLFATERRWSRKSLAGPERVLTCKAGLAHDRSPPRGIRNARRRPVHALPGPSCLAQHLRFEDMQRLFTMPSPRGCGLCIRLNTPKTKPFLLANHKPHTLINQRVMLEHEV